MEEPIYKNSSRWRLVTWGLAVLCVLLIIGIIVLSVLYKKELQASSTFKSKSKISHTDTIQEMTPVSTEFYTSNPPLQTSSSVDNINTSNPPLQTSSSVDNINTSNPPLQTSSSVDNIDTSEPDVAGIFHDLTTKELTVILNHVNSLPELRLQDTFGLTRSTLSVIDLILPSKNEALAYLDGSGAKPTRKARVILYRGDLSPPVVEEYMISLLPDSPSLQLIKYPNRRNPVEYSSRPINYNTVYYFMDTIEKKIRHILQESYDATFYNCANQCLIVIPFAVSSAYVGKFERRLWLQTFYFVEYITVHPLDISFYVIEDSTNYADFRIDKVEYGGQFWNTLDEFKSDYDSGSIKKSQFSFPNISQNSYSTLHRRGPQATPYSDRRPPHMVEPDGPRYTVSHKHIEYMNWQFDVRMSTFNGPQLYDIRFSGDRIAYEIGLQEIVAFYSGYSPTVRAAQLVDGTLLLGNNAQDLIPGVDCPETATYLPTYNSVRPKKIFCIFELNSGIPLRRHRSIVPNNWYSGMVDNCLVLRTILVLGNYDYVVDFIFHQSGIMEARVASTGYILAGVYSEQEKNYGFNIEDRLLGTLHNHMFHFKVDLDILGTSNRYETLEIKTVNVSNSDWINSPITDQTQIKFDRILKNSELEAAYKYNFDTPMEHIFYNKDKQTAYGVPRAYKIKLSGINKQLLPEGMLSESSISWARYQMAVTKHKDEEYTSTSIYALFDALDPVVNFTKFIEDDERIVDEDLVLWVSMGMYHIPHSEDLPLTQYLEIFCHSY